MRDKFQGYTYKAKRIKIEKGREEESPDEFQRERKERKKGQIIIKLI